MVSSNDLRLSSLSPCQRMARLIAEIANNEDTISALIKLRSEVEHMRATRSALCARVLMGDLIHRTKGAVDPVSKEQRDSDKLAYHGVVETISAFEARSISLTRRMLPYYAEIIDVNNQLKSDLASERIKVREKEGEIESSLAIRRKLQIDISKLRRRTGKMSKKNALEPVHGKIDLSSGSSNFKEEAEESAQSAEEFQTGELVELINIIKTLHAKVKILEEAQQINEIGLGDARKQQEQSKSEYKLVVAGQNKERQRATEWRKKWVEGTRQMVDLKVELNGMKGDLNYFKSSTNFLRNDNMAQEKRLDPLQLEKDLLEEKLRKKDSAASQIAQDQQIPGKIHVPAQAELLVLRAAREKVQRQAATLKDFLRQLEEKIRVLEILRVSSVPKHKDYRKSRQEWRSYAKRLRTELEDSKQELANTLADKDELSKAHKKLRRNLKGLLSSIEMEDFAEERIVQGGQSVSQSIKNSASNANAASEQADSSVTRRTVEVRKHFRNYPRRLAKQGKQSAPAR
ncbi:hypothetical protein JHW43_002948 [Diplocarpon mali]|nr:hypothetical protein JHW43_002948 [Diplocarpon mali]